MQVKTNKDLIINDLRISNLVMKRLKSNEIRDFGLAIKVEDSVTMNQGWRRGLIRSFCRPAVSGGTTARAGINRASVTGVKSISTDEPFYR